MPTRRIPTRVRRPAGSRPGAVETPWAFACVAVALAAGIAPDLAHAASEQVPVGPRAIAMGGAFTAVADDASAMFWNPAGLSQLQAQELAVSRARLYGADIDDSRLAFALPVARSHAAALEWYNAGFSDSELAFTENRFGLSWAWRPERRLAFGFTGKLVSRSYGLEGLEQQRGSGFGADLGALITPLPGVRAGLIAQDVFDTSIEYDLGVNAMAYPRNLRLGLAYDWKKVVTAAFDLDDRWHVGIEGRPVDVLSLQAGLQGDTDGPEGPTWSAGVGARVGILRVEYAYVAPPTLASTHHLGASLVFNFNPSLVRYEKVQVQRELYASLYKAYAEQPRSLGEAIVTTEADGPVEATLRVQIPGVMKAPTETQVTLRPGAQNIVPLRAIFDESVMAMDQDRPVQVEIGLTYTSLRLERTDTQRARTTLYKSGAIDWSRGMDQAAAYVTPLDPAIDALGGDVGLYATQVPLGALSTFPRETQVIATAMDALATLGIQYKLDPVNTFASVSERRGAVDTIYYPAETLARRVGDCDDTTVLTAALLTNLGVETCFVDAPGHIFLLADAGLTDSDVSRLTLPEGYLIGFDGRLWIPLETTQIREGFASVWEYGAASWNRIPEKGDRVLVPLSEARARWPAALPARTASAPARAIQADELSQRVNASAAEFSRWRMEHLETMRQLQEPPEATAAGWSEVARLDLAGGDEERARLGLRQALVLAPDDPRIQANLGTVDAGAGDLMAAAGAYVAALRRTPGDFVTWWNAAIVYEAAGDSSTATGLAAEAIRRAGGREALTRAAAAPEATRDDVTARALVRLLGRAGAVRGSEEPVDVAQIPPLRRAAGANRPRPELVPWLTWR